jgi:hypothetical protein
LICFLTGIVFTNKHARAIEKRAARIKCATKQISNAKILINLYFQSKMHADKKRAASICAYMDIILEDLKSGSRPNIKSTSIQIGAYKKERRDHAINRELMKIRSSMTSAIGSQAFHMGSSFNLLNGTLRFLG